MRRKLWIVFSLVTVLLVGLGARLYYIVRVRPADVASSQNSWTVSVATTRGTIYDRNLSPLVNDTREYRAALAPSESLLTHIYAATTQQQFSALRDQLSTGVPAMVRLTKPIGFADGMRLFWVPVRYSERLLAPHVIGYLDSGGEKGITGIEAAFDDLLNQYSGAAKASFDVDGRGNLLVGVAPKSIDTTSNSVGGVALTLDKEIQSLTEDVAAQYLKKGAVIVMSPNSGEILSVASFPTFQPDSIAQSIQSADGALLNRALSLYDCGSVFKIITTAAALEAGIASTREYSCDGYLEIEGTRFHCHNRLGHGRLTMCDAFAQSCNLYYIQLAQAVGVDALWLTVQKFGLGRSIDLAETITAPSALLPNKNTLLSSSAALANFSFGQGYLMATPLHFTQIIASIVNDGIMPSAVLIRGTVDENQNFSKSEEGRGERVISSENAALLRYMMSQVVTTGTGKSAQPDSCSAAGKTGTAETGQIVDGNFVTQSWFVGYFPAESPKYLICVLAEDAASTDVKATEIFRKLANAIYNNED